MIRTEIRERDLVGTFACPEGDGPFRAVLALGGSEGGVPEYLLRLLAPAGFACLALAYFHAPGTQPALVEVPLERIERGLRWLRAQPRVRASDGGIAIVGASKGSELALLTAATFPDLVGPVVAYTPSSVVWQGIDLRAPRPPLQSSWSLRGKPLPFVPVPADVPPVVSERGLSVLPIYERGLDDGTAVAAAAIPIERAVGPLLLVSGGDDRMWPAARMCRMAVERASRAARAPVIEHLSFPNAGHVLFPFELPAAPGMPFALDLGGSDAAARSAHAAAWPEVERTLNAVSRTP
jgi:dienelactone hydrolase